MFSALTACAKALWIFWYMEAVNLSISPGKEGIA